MEGFSAVVTTGIYCRPGCSARPRAENVRAFPLAAAAEAAGYRACLRCRPYRWPQCVTWTAPELVCRAVRLILDGALDKKTEADLGARLGVSARHLRRLFTVHLGVTPDGLARSARVHFARRLLDDTDLTVTEIAFAAGFGSLRQFNRACREVFRESPRELRARRRVSDRLVADGGLLLRLPFRGPLDWETMVAYFAARAIPGVEQVAGSTYRRTIVIGDDPGVLELGPGGDDHLLLRAHLPHWEELVHVVQRARSIASLDFDLGEPASHFTRDPTIGPLLRARPGVRPPGTWDPVETGVRAIIGQQVSVAAANTIAGRLVERLGTQVPGLEQLGLTHTFPSAAILARADLTGLGLLPGRAEAIRLFASAVTQDATPSASIAASVSTSSSARSRRSTASAPGPRTTSRSALASRTPARPRISASSVPSPDTPRTRPPRSVSLPRAGGPGARWPPPTSGWPTARRRFPLPRCAPREAPRELFGRSGARVHSGRRARLVSRGPAWRRRRRTRSRRNRMPGP